MANNIQKFLDQDGVSVLWSRIVGELSSQQEEISEVKTIANKAANDVASLDTRIEALEAGTYDDTELKGLINTNSQNINANTNAIAILNGTKGTAGSVAYTAAAAVAEVVAGANASFDTLKEIADWITNDTTGAAGMANDISALEQLVGSTAVATQIANALQVDGADKYALASALNEVIARVDEMESTGQTSIADCLAAAKAYADGLAKNYDAAGTGASEASKALASAKAYTDTAFTQIRALTNAEIDAAIASVV